MQSDLEEGEIPEFEVPSYVSARNRRGKLHGSRKVHSFTPLNARDRFKKGSKRYASPPSEGEYVYEEEQLPRKNRILHKQIYNSNFMGKAPKNLHPVQPTYGSVEVIMTKIGESLGRRSDYYYKDRRPKESRYLAAINDSRNINSMLRKTSPVFKRFEYNYYNKRRYSETNSESVNSIREKYGKTKSKKSFDARRSGKDVRIRRRRKKRKHSEISEGNMDKVDKFKKLRLFEPKDKGTRGRNKKPRKRGLKSLVFKEIHLPQEPEPEPQEKNVKEVKNSEDLNCQLDNPQDSLSHKVKESNLGDPPGVLNGDSAVINSTDKPEQLNDDDDDDDADLIRLRLLALTSNKRKRQSFTNNCLDTVKDLGKSNEENAVIKSKSYVADDEKTRDIPSSSNDETVKKSGFDNEIDRYELFLRAEALKTALLKKHQRILKKRKTFSEITQNREVTKGENSNQNNLVKGNEMDIDIISDEELLEKNLDGDFGAQSEVTENCEKLEIKDENKSDSENGKENKGIDIDQKRELQSENLVTAVEFKDENKSDSENGKENKRIDIDQKRELQSENLVTAVEFKDENKSDSENGKENKGIDIDQKRELQSENLVTAVEFKDGNKSDSENGKENKGIDIDQKREQQSENLVTVVETGHSEKISTSAESGTLELDKALSDVDVNVKNASVESQSLKKKAKRIRQKQIKKCDLNETNVSCENKDLCQETKFRYSPSSTDKNKADVGKKIFLVDTVTSSNPEINAASITCNTQSCLDVKQNHKSIISQKVIVLNNEEPAAKIPESERIIVHLGSDDSSDEEFVPNIEPDTKSRTVVNFESEKVDPLVSVTNDDKIKEFEKSVELLLRGARRKLEKSAELNSEIPTTPEAVYSHLAPSQRLEYMRLKQKIAEREKSRKVEKNNLNNPSPAGTKKSRNNSTEDKVISPITTPKNIGKRPIFDQNVGDNNKALNFKNRVTHKEVINPLDKNYAIHTPNYSGLGNSKSARINEFSNIKKPVPELNSQRESASTLKKDFTDLDSKNAIKKGPAEIIIERKKVLNQNRIHLERLKVLWKNIKIEKMVETKYEKEIKKLKIQQNFFEQKINQQRLKIKRMADESKQIYEAFQKNNKKVEIYSKRRRIFAKSENEGRKTEDSNKPTTEKNDAKDKEIGKYVAKNKEVRKEVAKEKEIGNNVAKEKEIGNDVTKEKEIGNDVTKEKEIGKDVAKELEIGNDVAKGKDIPSAVENDVRLIAEDAQIGVNEKREETETKAEEKVDNEKKFDTKEAVIVTDKDWVKEYKSPLENLTKRSVSSDRPRLDPNVIMCQYDLLGKCNDEECVFQHWRA